MSRVLLLNPPGKQNYIRDYFCSKLSKSKYISLPVTLLCLTGILGEQHEIMVLDAMVEGLSTGESLRRVMTLEPAVVISLVGAASWPEDISFLQAVKQATRAYIIAIGDILLEDTEQRLQEAPGIDAALLNFVTRDVLALLPSPSGQVVPNVVYRHPTRAGYVTGGRQKLPGEFKLACPRHDLFPLRKYRFPFMLQHPITAMLTDYGCPFQCTFCVMPALGFGLRPLGEVVEELVQIKHLGVKEIFFLDQTFGVRPERTLQLCRVLQEPSMGFKWSCFSRVDVLSPEMLRTMAQAGCHTIIFGIESSQDATLKHYNKKMNLANITKTLAACRQANIRVAATFILGLPGEDEPAVRSTIDWSLSLPLDYVSYNVAIPRAATGLRQEALAQGWLNTQVRTMDQSGLQSAMATPELSSEQILVLRREAVRRFYLRPSYWLRRVLTLRSWWDFKTQVMDGWGVLEDAWGLKK